MADFTLRLSNIPHEILAKIAQIEELKGRWSAGANLSPQTLGRLKRSVLITSTGASTRIEGAKLSEELKLNESLIKHFHKELLKHVEKDTLHRGNYKTQENKVEMIDEAGKSIGTLFDTTPAYLTPKEMTELVEWTKQALE